MARAQASNPPSITSTTNGQDARSAARRELARRQSFFDLDRLHVSVRLGSSRADMLYWGVLGEKPWRNYLHAHSFFEACYAFAGSGTFRIDGAEHTVKTGDLFLAKPGETHEIVGMPPGSGNSRAKSLGIYFWAFTLVRQSEHQTTDTDRSTDALLDALASSKAPVRRTDAAVARTLALLNDEIALKPPAYTQSIRGLTVKLLLETARTFTDGVPSEELDAPVRSTAQAIARTATRYLRDNFARPIEVRDVAAQVHLSERHLSRLFHKETGVSVLEFLTNLRVETAQQLLLDKNLSIKQVARSVGYPDPHYFTTLFGRRTGLTPAVFRRSGGTKFSDETKRGKG